MTCWAAYLLSAAAFAQLLDPQAGQHGGAPTVQTSAEQVQVFALAAEGSGEPVPEEVMKQAQPLLTGLPYKSYSLVSSEQREIPVDGADVSFALGERYRLALALQPGQNQEAIGARVRIVERSEPPRDAIRASGALSRGRPALFRNLPAQDAQELLVVVNIVKPNAPPQQQDQSNPQQGEQDEQKREQDEREPANEQGDKEKTQQPQQQDQQEQQPQSGENASEQQAGDQQQQMQDAAEQEQMPNDKQSLEAILRSLEETDKQEQKLNRRRAIMPLNGDWW